MARTVFISKQRLAIAAALLAALLYSGWWWLTARALTRSINHWIATEQAKGAVIAPAAMAVRGYPAAFSVTVKDIALNWPNGFGFSGQTVRVQARPWAPHTFKLIMTGGFAINLPPGSARPALTVAGETLRGKASFLDHEIPTDLMLTADTISASQTGAAGEAVRELTIATIELTGARPNIPPTSDTDVGLDLSLRLLDLSAQALESNPLGATISETAAHVRLMGQLPVTTDQPGLAAWRDAGGVINLDALAMRWGPLGLGGAGTVALDKDMQPEGAFTAHLTGFGPAIDALAAAGWVKPSAVGIARIALGIAARPGPDGQPIVDTPVTIQDRHISLGPVKLGQMPELKLD